MRVIARSTLVRFWTGPGHNKAEKPLRAWFAEAAQAKWTGPADIKAQYRNASFLKHNRVVFNIAGNTYRLVTYLRYDHQIVYIRFVGTHEEYDAIDAETV